MNMTIVTLLVTWMLLASESALGQIQFPERFETDKKKANQAGRIPLYSPTRCSHDELLYPGDLVNDWICDCAPAALYHPESDACFPAFRRGPCEAEHILILKRNEIIPECIRNPCKEDGKIPINNVCYQLGHGAPCNNTQLSVVLGVNPTTLLIDCVKLSLAVKTRFGEEETPDYDLANVELCARGTERSIKGHCPSCQRNGQNLC